MKNRQKNAKIAASVMGAIGGILLVVGIILVAVQVAGGNIDFENNPEFIIGVLLIVVGAVFLICIPAILAGSKRTANYEAALKEFMAHAGENPVLLAGMYTQKGEKGKAAAKTAASVAGSILGAAVLGVGVFKVYGAEKQMNYVLSDNGLYMIDPTQPLARDSIYFMPKGKFNEFEVGLKGNKIVITDLKTNDIFSFYPVEKQTSAEEISERLKKMIAECDETPEMGTEEPFAELNAEPQAQ